MWAVQHSPVSVEPQSTVQGVTSNSHGYLTTEMEPATGRSQLFSTVPWVQTSYLHIRVHRDAASFYDQMKG